MAPSHPFSPPLLHFLSSLALMTAVCASDIAASDRPTKLVDRVCSQTSSYSFCVKALCSDSRTPEADEYTIAFISVGLAYINATNTKNHIPELLEQGSGAASGYSKDLQRLQRCRTDYDKAVSAMEMAYNDLNSETYFELADLAHEAAHAASDCDAAFKGVPSPPLTKRNHDLMGLCEICAVVAKFFTAGSVR